MKANEIIRGILDLINDIDSSDNHPTMHISLGTKPVVNEPIEIIEPKQEFEHDDIRRFKQIIDLVNTSGTNSPFSNAPNEAYADIDAVTTNAGGGVNNPKHPSDMRVQHPSLYPGYQKTGE